MRKKKKTNQYVFIVIIAASFLIALPFAIKALIGDGASNGGDESGYPSQSTEGTPVSSEQSGDPDEQPADSSSSQKPPAPSSVAPPVSYNPPENADYSCFDDALFIGDSRTVGIDYWGKASNADFFADVGLNVYNYGGKSLEIKSLGGKYTLDSLMNAKQYGKVFIMSGVNEVGYPNKTATINNYANLVEKVKQKQPNAKIYVMANLHVSAAKSQSSSTINNKNLNELNAKIAALADNQRVFYLDVNPIYDDANGNLDAMYTSDGVHVYAKYYPRWTAWISENI